MEIFKWIEDIEKIYKDLIEKAKQESLKEIQILREEQENQIELSLKNKREIFNAAIKNLSESVKVETKSLEDKLGKIINNIEIDFKKHNEKLIELINDKIGF